MFFNMDTLIDYTIVNTGVAFFLGVAIYYYFFMSGKVDLFFKKKKIDTMY